VIFQEAVTTFSPTLQATIKQRRLKNIFLEHDEKDLLTVLSGSEFRKVERR
jgi:hypothetical protein